MANARFLQTNFTAGVLDPKLAAREDITFYYNGLADGKNMIIIPQGGGTARPALQYAREIAFILNEVDLSGATPTAPQGGTAANAIDDNETTLLTTSNNLSTTNPFVIAHLALASATDISAVDIINYSLGSGALSDEIRIQTSPDDAAWTDFGTAFNWDATQRSRRVRNESGPVNASYVRLVRIGATDIAAVANVGEIRLWSESADLSSGRLLPFAHSTEEAYMLVATDRNIDVMKGAAYSGAIAIPHTSAQIPLMNYTQSLDTMLIFHKNVQPWRIFRQGDDDEFDFRTQAFENTPQYDYGAGTGGTDEVQTINDGGTLSTSGDKFTLLLEGYRTTTITVGGSRGATASAIQTALRALANTSASGITVADASGNGFTVTFGGDDGKAPWNEMTASVMKGSALLSISRTTRGEPEGEDIMSATRGWPRCGIFKNSRLHLGGILGVPDALLSSAVGDYFNFDINKDDEERALLVRAESDQVSAIYDIISGKRLVLFTNDGEMVLSSSKIDKDTVPEAATDDGSKEGLKAKRAQGGYIFVQGVKDEEDDNREIGTSLKIMVPDDTLATEYKTILLSKLSGHLVKNPVDFDFRKAKNTDENDLGILVNDDGSAVTFTILREDDVNAMVPMTLRDGDKVLAVAIDKKRRIYFITERVINGTARRYVEIWNNNLYLDCGGILTMTAESVTAASAAQDEYIYTFTSPGSAADIAVRVNGGRLDASEFSVDLGTKTVTLEAALAANIVAGDIIRIAILENTVSGIDHLEGETIQTFVDGAPGESYTVSGGEITISPAADTEIQYGFDFEVSGRLMPFRIPETQTLSGEIVPIINVVLNLYQTIGIDLKVNGGDWRNIPLQKTDTPVLDKSALQLLFTGERKEEGFAVTEAIGAPLEFRRPSPGPFTVLGITREVNI